MWGDSNSHVQKEGRLSFLRNSNRNGGLRETGLGSQESGVEEEQEILIIRLYRYKGRSRAQMRKTKKKKNKN